MAEVRAKPGVPVAADFAGLGAPTQCAPVVVDSSTGFLYSLKTNDVVVPVGLGGTVTSVGLSLPSIITVSGSPVTGSGTLTGSLVTQTANRVWAGPTTGAAAAPTFRALGNADLPATAVTPGSYTFSSITVNQQGVITAAANGATLSSAGGGTGQNWSASSGVPLVTAGTFSLQTGASGTFTTVDAKTVTVVSGVITSIV